MVIENIRVDEDGERHGQTHIKRFNETINVVIEEGSTIEYAELCIAYLNNMVENMLTDLFSASIRYCHHFNDDVGEDPITFAEPTDVLAHITPTTLAIPKPQDKRQPAFSLGFHCTWEEEHGLEWSIHNDQITYVGAYEMTDPYSNHEKDSEYNYVSTVYIK